MMLTLGKHSQAHCHATSEQSQLCSPVHKLEAVALKYCTLKSKGIPENTEISTENDFYSILKCT